MNEYGQVAEYEQTIAEQKQTIAEQKQTIAEQKELIAAHIRTIKVKDTLYLEADAILKGVLQLLTKLVELRDPYTKGHSQRVADMVVKLASQDGIPFSSDRLRFLQNGALLHDIGKVGINDLVLNKPTLLTEAELVMIQQHTVIGYKLIFPLEFDPIIPDIILNHHENFDGTGYPLGLKGEQIPLAVRMVKLADVYDALTSSRPYRVAYSPAQAVEIMREDSQHYDPSLLEVFVDLITEKI